MTTHDPIAADTASLDPGQSGVSGREEPGHEPGRAKFGLVVLEGQKTGARADLEQGRAISVGCGFDCDIVLGNIQEALGDQRRHKVEITPTEHACSIQVIEGIVRINDVLAEPGDAFPVAIGTPVNLGSSVFALESLGRSPVAGVEAAELGADNGKNKSRFTALAVSAALGLCFVVAGVSAYITGESIPPTSPIEQPNLDAMFETAGMAHLNVKTTAENRYAISGRVATRAQQMELKSILGKVDAAVSVAVTVDEDFTDDVADVYRLSGIEATVELLGEGNVAVVSAVADTDFLQQVESRAHQDVVGLTTLERRNSPPLIVQEKKPDFTAMPGKRITMVIATKPAFILTEDGSRYFEGSILPSGYKVASIEEKKIKLERDDEVVDLIF